MKPVSFMVATMPLPLQPGFAFGAVSSMLSMLTPNPAPGTGVPAAVTRTVHHAVSEWCAAPPYNLRTGKKSGGSRLEDQDNIEFIGVALQVSVKGVNR